MQTLLQDIRYALRQMKKSPGFAATVMLTLALGIGATTAIFTLVYDGMLRPLPFAGAGRLVTIHEHVAEWSDLYPTLPVSANHFTFWKEHSHSFAAMAAMREYSLTMGTGQRPSMVKVLTATPGIFGVLRVAPMLGRAFTAAEATPGRADVAILTYGLWQREFGGERDVVGKTFMLNGRAYTVIGVMPESFHMPPVEAVPGTLARRTRPLGVVIPLAFSKDRLAELMGDLNYFALARLKPGVSVAAANAELNAEQRTISAMLPAGQKADLSAVVTPWQRELVGSNQRPLILLLAAVAGLLLVGCMNLTNLLLARAVGQRRQAAVACALGASRMTLLRMGIREAMLLATLGSGLGILLASFLIPVLQPYLPATLDFRGPLHLNWASVACAVGLALGTALLAGIAPAWMSSRTAPRAVLQGEAKLASEPHGSRDLRRVLVGGEVAISVGLVLVTGLVTASMARLMQVERGFTVEHTVTAQVELPGAAYSSRQKRVEFFREMLARLHRLPDVEAAAITNVLPLTGGGWGDAAVLPGNTKSWAELPEEQFRWVSPGYFEAIHLRLLKGRFFDANDAGRNDAVITELTAQRLWKGRDPIGRHFHLAMRQDQKPFTVVGVVANAHTMTLAKPDPMLIYVPYWYRCNSAAGLVVRAHEDPMRMADAIRKSIWSIDRSVPVPRMRTLGGVVADSVANRRFEMDLLLAFAMSALLLAGLGVYGVVTYSVVQRKREIALRIALGAQRREIYKLILLDGLLPVAVGGGVGIAAALGLAHAVRDLLFHVSPYNPVMVIGSLGILLLIGFAACLLPASRAAGVDPMEALRNE